MKNNYSSLDEIKLLKRSKLYVEAMSQGINPLTGEFVEDSVICDTKIQNCLEYVAYVLDKLIDNGGLKKSKEKRVNNNTEVIITREQAERINFSKEPIGITELAKKINEVIDENVSKRVSGYILGEMLVQSGYLDYEGEKKKKITNDKSKEIGIITVERQRYNSGEIFSQIMYSEQAQKFVAYHLITE